MYMCTRLEITGHNANFDFSVQMRPRKIELLQIMRILPLPCHLCLVQ